MTVNYVTIRVLDTTRARIESHKRYRRETMDEVTVRLLDLAEESLERERQQAEDNDRRSGVRKAS